MQVARRKAEPSQIVISILLRQCGELYLERLGELARCRLARRVIAAVIRHPVDEEKTEHLDPARLESQLGLQVALERVFDLRSPDVVPHPPDFLARS